MAAGVIRSGERFLVARRKPGSHLAGAWEFPGGRIAAGEDPERALRRELEEEVGVTFQEAFLLHVEEHGYADRTVVLHFFLCLDPQREPQPAEGQELRWATLAELETLETPPANRQLIAILKEQFG